MAANTDSDHSDDESFKSAKGDEVDRSRNPGKDTVDIEEDAPAHRLSAEEEASLLESSNISKANGNTLFTRAEYSDAIQAYDKALGSLPNYLEYEIAVLRANIAACHLKMQQWQEAVDSATQTLECLERLDPTLRGTRDEKADNDVDGRKRKKGANEGASTSGVVQEVDDDTAGKIEALEKSGRTREEVLKIRIKALMRRAKGRQEMGGWAHLQGAEEGEPALCRLSTLGAAFWGVLKGWMFLGLSLTQHGYSDYKELTTIPTLSPLDHKTVQRARVALPSRIEAAKQREMGDMMGKLKDLGNGILKPFGLSTNNFQFTKDENSGGYSMQFNQDAHEKR
ncbi:MAG: hypothetical protein M1831_003574 [Alyxoria varia]|nr:MAG: hypothetical protein M1831_003574 [Alyxoria varia]